MEFCKESSPGAESRNKFKLAPKRRVLKKLAPNYSKCAKCGANFFLFRAKFGRDPTASHGLSHPAIIMPFEEQVMPISWRLSPIFELLALPQPPVFVLLSLPKSSKCAKCGAKLFSFAPNFVRDPRASQGL